MNRENARQEIRRNWRTLITSMTGEARRRVNGEASYICPLCGHGEHGDGLTVNPKSKDGYGLKCFGCNFSGDIIDLFQQTEKTDYSAALSLLAQQIGIAIEDYTPTGAQKAPQERIERATRAFSEKDRETPAESADPLKGEKMDYTAYYAECRERANDPEAAAYLAARGISQETAAAYWVGYDPNADPAGAGYPSKRIIVPVNAEHYIARAIDPANKLKKLNPKGSTPGIFNLGALFDAQQVQEVFIVEGAFDALSILEAGAAAVALNSTANADKLIETLKGSRTSATLILCLDNDDAGRKATETIKTGLQRLNISYTIADICNGAKDPNEALQKDRAAFEAAIARAQMQAAARPDNTRSYIDNLMAGEIAQFKSETKTGYPNLDRETGGLYSGLYAIAAISSLGKTTFAQQMADQIAAAGYEVLFFSLEQSRLELVSKSIARITAQNDPTQAVSSLSIRRGFFPDSVRRAAEQYKEQVQDRISIIEGNFACDISFIGDYIRQYIRRNGAKPVVFIDYLQILQPETNAQGRQQTTKETVDSTITELKRLSREQGLTIFVISSVNRANYLTPVDFESLKESGGIEYTADCVWGLQLQCLNEAIFDKANNIKERRERIKEAKAESPRKIELVCLKNRCGIANFSCYFDYYPENDLFQPGEREYTEQRKAGRRL